MTTGIALVRENAESMQPPRALAVSFSLGRPLGIPNDAAFQHRVIAAALNLLEYNDGPVLEDFPEDAPEVDVESAPICPVSFLQTTSNSTWQERLSEELATLKPWYDMGRRRRGGRTLVGASEVSIEANIRKLGEYLDADQLPTEELYWFKRAIEDAKIYYIEAFTAQPGSYNHNKVYATLWSQTLLGAGLAQFYQGFSTHPELQSFARIILPRDAVANATGTKTETRAPNTGPSS